MADSFFFYDLETSGFSAVSDRIMQFAGQRTDMQLKPIGEPVNYLVKMTPDILPDPGAVLVTGITPQATLTDGLTEAEFLEAFYSEVVKPGTIFTGFNSVRFDDEFVRYLNYRNYYDAYEWHWKDGNSRWDILDLVRMTRALRPDGIKWPFSSDGKPTNRLEMLTDLNGLEHSNAHDALSDVMATIAVANLVKTKQPKLFEHLLKMRDKQQVEELVSSGQPFVYTSGRYPSQYLHTTIAVRFSKHPQTGASLVYDLRHDPTPFINMSVDELVDAWRFSRDPEKLRLPVKTLKYNRCPAVAPVGVIKDAETEERIGLSIKQAQSNLATLKKHQTEFAAKVTEAVAKLDAEREGAQVDLLDDQQAVDGQLYDGFIGSRDKDLMVKVRTSAPEAMNGLAEGFQDGRLKTLLTLYKGRNYPSKLSGEERVEWDKFCQIRLLNGGDDSRLAKYFAKIEELAATQSDGQNQYLLEELKLYGESILPADEVH